MSKRVNEVPQRQDLKLIFDFVPESNTRVWKPNETINSVGTKVACLLIKQFDH
jgi:hypothetical protein